MSDAPRSPSLRSPDRSPSLRQRLEERIHRRLDDFEEWVAGPPMSPAGACIGNCANGMEDIDCAGLRREMEAVRRAREKARLSDEIYKPRDERTLPEGYSHATDDELEALGLLDRRSGRSLLRSEQAKDFHADVFSRPGGGYTIAFRGTDPNSFGDIVANARQGLGWESAYYSQAMRIGQQVAANAPGQVDFTGHSLGGGLAAAAAVRSGAPATTFNTAGLHTNNIPRGRPNSAIENWYVRGDGLSIAQDGTSAMPPPVGRRIPLDPVRPLPGRTRTGAGPIGRIREIGDRSLRLHGIGEARQSLAAKQIAIAELQKKKGCSP